MFTGIVTGVGELQSVEPRPEALALSFAHPYRGLALGESVAVDGACLTVAHKGRGWFGVEVVKTTLERTRFREYRPGQAVNLERALAIGDRLGGHMVQGHVDGVGAVVDVREGSETRLVDLRVPPAIHRVSIPLGSITVDGVSLTVNGRSAPDLLQVSLIPFSLQHTTLGRLEPGSQVHLEADAIGKYVDHLLAARDGTHPAESA